MAILKNLLTNIYLQMVEDLLGCITFNTAGSFTYDCSIGNHAAQGMVATITVVEVANSDIPVLWI